MLLLLDRLILDRVLVIDRLLLLLIGTLRIVWGLGVVDRLTDILSGWLGYVIRLSNDRTLERLLVRWGTVG